MVHGRGVENENPHLSVVGIIVVVVVVVVVAVVAVVAISMAKDPPLGLF